MILFVPYEGVAHCTLDAALYNRENARLAKANITPTNRPPSQRQVKCHIKQSVPAKLTGESSRMRSEH
jgi:hypothetical protein